MNVELTVNGKTQSVQCEDRTLLVDLLREQLGLTGTHFGCDTSQCGYCTPGMIMASTDLLRRHPDPTDEQIREGLAGNLCRCTGYVNIVAAVKQAASLMRDAASQSA